MINVLRAANQPGPAGGWPGSQATTNRLMTSVTAGISKNTSQATPAEPNLPSCRRRAHNRPAETSTTHCTNSTDRPNSSQKPGSPALAASANTSATTSPASTSRNRLPGLHRSGSLAVTTLSRSSSARVFPGAMLISGVWSDLKKRRILLVDHQNDHNQQKRIRHDRFYP